MFWSFYNTVKIFPILLVILISFLPVNAYSSADNRNTSSSELELLSGNNQYEISVFGGRKFALESGSNAPERKSFLFQFYENQDRNRPQFLKLHMPSSSQITNVWRMSMNDVGQNVVTVSTATELKSALAAANGETTILLESGNYGYIGFWDQTEPFAKFSSEVTIKSADPSDPAIFTGLGFNGVENLTLDSVQFDYTAETAALSYIKPFKIINSSNITIKNSNFDGDVTQGINEIEDGYGTGYGLFVRNSSEITIEGNEFQTWYRAGIFSGVDGLVVNNNNVYDIRSDGFDFADVDNVEIAGNYIHDFRRSPLSGDHPDMIQFWTNGTTSPSTNVTIRDNILDSGAGDWTQSIFIRNEVVDSQGGGEEMFYQNFTIENNVIYNAHAHGITVGETDGLIIRNNTLLQNEDSASGGAVYVPTINISPDARDVLISNNILPRFNLVSREGQVIENNLVVQRNDPEGENYVGDLFVNALADSDATLADLQAVPGGLVEQMGVGASATAFGANGSGIAGFVTNDAGSGLSILEHSFDASNIFGSEGGLDLDGAQIIWDFGDGQSGTSLTPTHAFQAAGTFNVTATVTLGDGEVVVLRKTVEVDTPVALKVDFNANANDQSSVETSANIGAGVTFEDVSDGQAVRLNGDTLGYRGEELLNNSEYTLFFDFKKDPGNEDAGGRIINFSHSFVIFMEPDGITASVSTTAGNPWIKTKDIGINDAEWHRVALTFSGETGNAILYLDGQEIGRATGLQGGVQVGNPSQNLFLGDPWGEGFPGLIDNVAFLRGAIDPEDANAGMAIVDELEPDVVPPADDEGDTSPDVPGDTPEPEPEPADDDEETPPEVSYNLMTGTFGSEALNGTDGADLIVGLHGKDNIQGGDGADKLLGGANADTIDGGDGDDIIEGGHGRDTLIGGNGRDTFVFKNAGDSAVGTFDVIKDFNIDEDTLDFSSMGYSGFADPGGEAAFGELTYRYENGNTIIEDGFGKFQVVLENVSTFDPGSAQFSDQPVPTGEGDDVISSYVGWAQRDEGGSFILDLQGGDDTVNISNFRDDIIDGGDGNDVVSAGHGADILFGGSGNDSLNGQAHRDVLDGGDGDDILNGGHDLDILTGGAGRDTFVFDKASDSSIARSDIITDFVSGEDVLDLRSLGLAGYSQQDGGDAPNLLQSRTEGDKTFLFNTDTGFQVEFLGNIDITAEDLLL